MEQLEEEIDKLLDADAGAKGLRSVPELDARWWRSWVQNLAMWHVFNVQIR